VLEKGTERVVGRGFGPVWSADGARLAFVSVRDGNREIYTQAPDGAEARRLTSDDHEDVQPAWSPDGRRIAFASDRFGEFEILVLDADGDEVQRLTDDSSCDHSPAWSPDGRRIAFVSARDGNDEIYVMNADGKDARRLTDAPKALDEAPRWSPDGTRIAFMSTRDDAGGHGAWPDFDIYVMTAKGGNEVRLTTGGGHEWPAWTADGKTLLHLAADDGRGAGSGRLALIDVHAKRPERALLGDVEAWHASGRENEEVEPSLLADPRYLYGAPSSAP
jgi:TolB protein